MMFFLSLVASSCVASDLGPLEPLLGTWAGNMGVNSVQLPCKANTTGCRGFIELARPYYEIITFSEITHALIKDRSETGSIDYPGLQYELRIMDKETNDPLHVESGMWLRLPASDGAAPSIARQALIPHGDAIMALGRSQEEGLCPKSCGDTCSAPQVPCDPSVPESCCPLIASDLVNVQPVGNILRGYFADGPNLPDFPFNTGSDITINLREALANVSRISGRHVKSFTRIDVSTDNDQGGILNIPFVRKHANAMAFNCTYWIETMSDGSLQLQYLQSTDLVFLEDRDHKLIVWKHINLNTLFKQ